MSIKSFTQIFVCTGMLYMCGAALSCSQSNETKISLVISKLSSAQNSNDSILAIRDLNLSQQEKDNIINALSDSTIEFKALAIATILSHEELSEYVISNPSRELIAKVSNRLLAIDGAEAVSQFANKLDAKFKTLTSSQQAQFLTKVATPAECAANLEASDDALKAEIEKIYTDTDNKSALTQFEQSLKQNN